MNEMPNAQTGTSRSPLTTLFSWLVLLFALYLLLLAVAMVGDGFKLAAGTQAQALFAFAEHPLAGLMVGLLATALIQSSSTVTSIIVGLVAGGLPIATAIPMIMGANIGTTLTNTLVSLGHLRCNNEFRRAFACATIHDFFNLLAVVIFLPLEMAFGILAHISEWLVAPLSNSGNLNYVGFDFIKPLTKPVVSMVKSMLNGMSPTLAGTLMALIGIVLIMAAITGMGKLLKRLMVGRAQEVLKHAIGRGPLHGITSGAAVTVLVQSSSTTTSLMVPFVGNGLLSLREVYPFTLGANIGTCITALLAATAISGPNALLALQIALVHLSFNVLAVLVIYGIPALRRLPLRAAEGLASLAIKNRMAVLGYLSGVFFVLPGILLLATR
ncbi:Na/Pi symporter [Plesiomonas shigelloides]|uniref:Na/Pi symporter n=1 Tax=Plesiomonas shigelloides TaxID=703 RepID=UPI001261539B|nr:Na/Pi symporter [Plesiomonas shigelloides]KAB7687121.1 Na/Pi cotransporter family protein [Plesiomonas shigelloides]